MLGSEFISALQNAMSCSENINEEYLKDKSEEFKIPIEELALMLKECKYSKKTFESRIANNKNCLMLETIENVKRMKLDNSKHNTYEDVHRKFKYVIGTGIVPMEHTKVVLNDNEIEDQWLPSEICQDPFGTICFIVVFRRKTIKFRVNEDLTVKDIKVIIKEYVQANFRLLRVGVELLDEESVKVLKNFVIDAI